MGNGVGRVQCDNRERANTQQDGTACDTSSYVLAAAKTGE